MLITLAPNLTESSIADTMSSLYAPPPLFEKTFMSSNCAFGATPTTYLVVSEPVSAVALPFAAAIPATCMPCISEAPVS